MVSKNIWCATSRELTNIRGAADLTARTVVVSSALGLRSGEADRRRYGKEKLDIQNHLREVTCQIQFGRCARGREEETYEANAS